MIHISFNAEWGYSTSNFIQMGFAPQGDVNYRTGFNARETIDPGNWVAGSTLPTNISDYDGPSVPNAASKAIINTEALCDSITYGKGCVYIPTSTITLPTNAKISNSNKYNPTFKAAATGDLGGGQNDEWILDVVDGAKTLTNEKSGL